MNQICFEVDAGFQFFCPATGKRIVGPRGISPSPATQFVYFDEIGDVEWYDEALKPLWDRINDRLDEDDDCDESPWSLFCRELATHHPHIGLFAIAENGMACGPVQLTFTLGIDFRHANVDEEDGGDDFLFDPSEFSNQ